MYEKNRPFGVIKDNMVVEVESYTDELYDRAMTYLQSATASIDTEHMYTICMQQKKLAEALIWKCAMREDTQNLNDKIRIRQRLVMYLEMIKDQVNEMIEETDFGFLEHMGIEELRKELNSSYDEQDVAAIIFYVCASSLRMQMARISGIDE
jgi:hypothetical protein